MHLSGPPPRLQRDRQPIRADTCLLRQFGQDEVSRLVQRTAGFGLQFTDSQDRVRLEESGHSRHGLQDSTDTFAQAFQYGTFDAGSQHSFTQVNPLNDETVISLSGSNKILGVYLTDTLSPEHAAALHRSTRYNRNTETLNGFSVDTDWAMWAQDSMQRALWPAITRSAASIRRLASR